jgi:hypothetical protein
MSLNYKPYEGFPEDSPYSAKEISDFDDFLSSTCSDGFWYGLTMGGHISPGSFYDEEIKIMVESKSSDSIKYTLFNKVGQIIHSENLISVPFEIKMLDVPMLKELKPDFYYIKIEVGMDAYYGKFVKG